MKPFALYFRLGVSFLLCLAGCTPSSEPGRSRPERIILVTLDTLRADHLSFMGYPRETAPFLAFLARDGLVFTRAYAASSHTNPSHASIFTGRYPYEHGALMNGLSINAAVPTMAELLRDAGFQTAGFTPVGFVGSLSRGFTSFAEKPEQGYFTGEFVVEAAADWLTSYDKRNPGFLWFHLFDVHEWNRSLPEYEAVESVTNISISGYVEHRYAEEITHRPGFMEMLNAYDQRIRYADDRLKELFELFNDEHTLWIITADHGEGLGNHGYNGHGQFLYEEQLHVPLVFYFAGGAYAGQRVDEMVRLIDIFPTVLALTGVEVPPDVEGINLLESGKAPENLDLESFAQRRPSDHHLRKDWKPMAALQDHARKLVYLDGFGYAGFDRVKDPFEQSPIRNSGELAVYDLQGRLDGHVLAMTNAVPDDGVGFPERHEQELRSLGYIR